MGHSRCSVNHFLSLAGIPVDGASAAASAALIRSDLHRVYKSFGVGHDSDTRLNLPCVQLTELNADVVEKWPCYSRR